MFVRNKLFQQILMSRNIYSNDDLLFHSLFPYIANTSNVFYIGIKLFIFLYHLMVVLYIELKFLVTIVPDILLFCFRFYLRYLKWTSYMLYIFH